MARAQLAMLTFVASAYHAAALILRQEPAAQQDHERLCMASAVALDFETNRVLDWVAYHHLIGVDCFVLFYDRNHCDLSKPRSKGVFQELMNSDLVTMVNSTYSERLGEETGPSVHEVSEMVGGAHYLAVVDVDEFIVMEPGVELKDTLHRLVADHGHLGLYLNRWTFGTNGYVDQVDVSEMPEFYHLTERSGDENRTRAPHNEPRTGKSILNLPTGVDLWGVHSWHPSPTHPNATMILPDTTELTKKLGAHFINRYKTHQNIWINHYMSGSLNECIAKASEGDHHRSRWEECKILHPGAKEYVRRAMRQDRFLADAWGLRTKQHRDELFPNAHLIYSAV